MLDILPQPDDVTCGPTCLHAVYGFYGDRLSIRQVIDEVVALDTRGTLGVLLGCHALERGYAATLHTYNLEIFDPTWFTGDVDLADRVRQRAAARPSPRLRFAAGAYLRFLELGGRIEYDPLTPELIAGLLARGAPVLTGLSATYLYNCAREVDEDGHLRYDDIAGDPTGHFVVLYGFHPATQEVLVADPLHGNPLGGDHHYAVGIQRLLGAILLGVVTYDGNLLVLEPGGDPVS